MGLFQLSLSSIFVSARRQFRASSSAQSRGLAGRFFTPLLFRFKKWGGGKSLPNAPPPRYGGGFAAVAVAWRDGMGKVSLRRPFRSPTYSICRIRRRRGPKKKQKEVAYDVPSSLFLFPREKGTYTLRQPASQGRASNLQPSSSFKNTSNA